jgi:hypothetical protein
MDADEIRRAASMEMAEAIFNGSSLLQMVVWRSFVARHEATLVDGLTQLEEALQKFIDLRERGLAKGGPEHATMEDVERVRRLRELVSAWFAGGERSPEIEPLARRLFALVGGGVAGLPPED